MAPALLKYEAPIVVAPKSGQATSSMIFLHGLGDSGHGWSDVASQLSDRMKNMRFIFPHAPQRPITLNWGMQMPGWYDISSLEAINQTEDEDGLKESMRYVEELIAGEVAKGVPANRIAVAGFSQGGAVALLMLRSPTKLGAVIGLSTYLPLADAPTVVSDANKGTPVLMGHGDADNVVAYKYGLASHAKLTNLGVDADFATYQGMPHSACASELKDVEDFLAKHLS